MVEQVELPVVIQVRVMVVLVEEVRLFMATGMPAGVADTPEAEDQVVPLITSVAVVVALIMPVLRNRIQQVFKPAMD